MPAPAWRRPLGASVHPPVAVPIISMLHQELDQSYTCCLSRSSYRLVKDSQKPAASNQTRTTLITVRFKLDRCHFIIARHLAVRRVPLQPAWAHCVKSNVLAQVRYLIHIGVTSLSRCCYRIRCSCDGWQARHVPHTMFACEVNEGETATYTLLQNVFNMHGYKAAPEAATMQAPLAAEPPCAA